jgi:Rieske Fe-S protein
VHRRTLLVWAIGGALAAIAAVTAGVLAVFVQPAPPLQQRLRLGRPLAQLRDGDVVAIAPEAGAAFVLADGGGNNRAGDIATRAFVVRSCGRTDVLAATCSHLGCAVVFDTTEERLVCPCHGSQFEMACGGSRFAIDGSVVRGPALRPLSHVRWSPGAAPDEILLERAVSPPAPPTAPR